MPGRAQASICSKIWGIFKKKPVPSLTEELNNKNIEVESTISAYPGEYKHYESENTLRVLYETNQTAMETINQGIDKTIDQSVNDKKVGKYGFYYAKHVPANPDRYNKNSSYSDGKFIIGFMMLTERPGSRPGRWESPYLLGFTGTWQRNRTAKSYNKYLQKYMEVNLRQLYQMFRSNLIKMYWNRGREGEEGKRGTNKTEMEFIYPFLQNEERKAQVRQIVLKVLNERQTNPSPD